MKRLLYVMGIIFMITVLLVSCDGKCESHIDDDYDGICDKCEEALPEYTPQIDHSENGLELTLSRDGAFYEVTGIGECEDAALVIPDSYNSIPITSIGASDRKSVV